MTRHVPISDFKDHASELVAAAEGGEEIIITRHGKPAGRLGPVVRPHDPTLATAAMQRILARREFMREKGMTATSDDWISWKNEGQR